MARHKMTPEEKAERREAEVKETVRRARTYLANPIRWTKGTLVRAQNNEVGRCILGAIDGQKGAKYKREAKRLIEERLHRDGYQHGSIPAFNDAKGTTHDAVLGLLDRTLNDTILIGPLKEMVR